ALNRPPPGGRHVVPDPRHRAEPRHRDPPHPVTLDGRLGPRVARNFLGDPERPNCWTARSTGKEPVRTPRMKEVRDFDPGAPRREARARLLLLPGVRLVPPRRGIPRAG